MTASNLFKYCQPCHGLVLFKHHQPLEFSLQQLADLLLCARAWFQAAHSAHPSATYPFFLWNCGARAGASQYHGHAQVALSKVEDFRTLKIRVYVSNPTSQHGLQQCAYAVRNSSLTI